MSDEFEDEVRRKYFQAVKSIETLFGDETLFKVTIRNIKTNKLIYQTKVKED